SLLGKGEQRLDGGERPVLAGGLETSLPQVSGEGLQVRQRDPRKGFGNEAQKAVNLGGVAPSGMAAGLGSQPETHHLRVLGVIRGCEGRQGNQEERIHVGTRIARYLSLSCMRALLPATASTMQHKMTHVIFCAH